MFLFVPLFRLDLYIIIDNLYFCKIYVNIMCIMLLLEDYNNSKFNWKVFKYFTCLRPFKFKSFNYSETTINI